MAANGCANLGTNEIIVSSLCKHFLLDPEPFFSDAKTGDLKMLYGNILKASGKESQSNDEKVMKWIYFSNSFPTDSEACSSVLNELNAELSQKSVILGQGLTPSEADIIVFATVHSSVIALSNADKEKYVHVLRWMDYIQSNKDFGGLLQNILLEKPGFDPPVLKSSARAERDSNAKNAVQSTKVADKPEAESSSKRSDTEKKAAGDKDTKKAGGDKDIKKATGDKDTKKAAGGKDTKKAAADKEEKKKTSETEADKEVSVSILKIQVGLIRKAWKHPSADSLLVEEIDVGDVKLRQVVSGLAKYCNPDQLTNRRVVLITNVKPGKLRDVMSEGLVLCASNEDHAVVEPLIAPEGARIGEQISFSGIDGKPEDVLNPKKKQLEKVTPHLFTDEKGVATFKGIPFMTSAGPCTSSICKGTVK